jgi:hypothetical protein
MRMPKWFWIVPVAWFAVMMTLAFPLMKTSAQTAISVNIPGCVPAAGAVSALMVVNGRVQCVPLGTGLAFTSGMLTVAPGATYTPAWQVETVSLSSTPTTATSITYTPAKPVASGTVLWWYQSANLLESASGAVQYVGAPLAIGLPAGWATTDSVLIAYQSQ